jgi:hypothetical protein
MRKELKQWYLYVEKDAVMEMENFKFLVERNEEIILNYFVKGGSSAKAKAINNKIQRFITTNRGTRDREFFTSDLPNIFPQHLKMGFSPKTIFRSSHNFSFIIQKKIVHLHLLFLEH